METRKMKPILFSTPMVRKVLAGEKTVTRRAIKPQPVLDAEGMWQWRDCQWMNGGIGFPKTGIEDYAPYKPGDILWVRETWMRVPIYEQGPFPPQQRPVKEYAYFYKADESSPNPDNKWRPSTFMPREAARIFLRVRDVRAERLQEISGQSVLAEGVDNGSSNPTMGKRWENMQRMAFADLWNSINAKRNGGAYAWEKNPWVWVIEFEGVEQP